MQGHSHYGICFVAITTLITATAVSAQTTCINDNDPCVCDLVDGSGKIDLTPIGNLTGPRFENLTLYGKEGYLYSYNPCYAFTSSDGTITGLAALETYSMNDDKYDDDIGLQANATFSQQDSAITISYTSGDNVSYTTVKLVCDKSSSNESVSLDSIVDYDKYNFTMKGPNVCPKKGGSSSGGLSAGSVLTIIFFVLLFLYLVCGVIYNKKKNDAQGADMIPNKEFWISIPGLMKDGVLFLVSKCKRQPSEVYGNI